MNKKLIKKLFPLLLLSFVNGLGFSIFLPMTPFLVEDFGQGAIFFGLLTSVYSVGQFFAAPIMGALSDKLGRRPMLIGSQLGTLLSLLCFLGALFLPTREILGVSLPLWGMLLARLLDGITGGNNSVAQAYLADISTPQQRSKIFGMFAAMMGVAMMVGPAIGGWASALANGYVITILIAAVISFFALMFLIFFLRETVTEKHKFSRNMSEFRVFKNRGILNAVPALKKWFFFYGFFSVVFVAFTSINLLYAKDMLGLDESSIGTMYFVIGISMIFHQVVSLRLLTKKFSNKTAFFLGIILIGITMTLYRLQPGITFFYANMIALTLGISLSMVSFKAIVTSMAPEGSKGKVTGLDESVGAASRAIVPLMSTALYAAIGYFAFGSFGLLLLAAVLAALLIWRKKKKLQKIEQ